MATLERVLLAVIALGLWANVAVTLIQPASAQLQPPNYLALIAADLHSLVSGDGRCQNRKICD